MQDVVAGKRRTRRRGGAGGLLGSDESDEEDDEEARALRQRLAKKRRVMGDTLDALARDPATASFHATYQMALVDDAEEFAHLDRDEELDLEEEPPGQDREGGEGVQERRGEVADADEDVVMADSELPAREEKRTRKGEISAAEVRKVLQEVARGERVRSHPLLTLFLECSRGYLTRIYRNITRSIRRTCPGWINSWRRQTKQRHRTCACAWRPSPTHPKRNPAHSPQTQRWKLSSYVPFLPLTTQPDLS